MLNKIDLDTSSVRTDLAIEVVKKDNVSEYEEEIYDDIVVTRINLTDKDKINTNKEKGKYITISFNDVTNYEDRNRLGKVLVKELNNIFISKNIKDDDTCLIVGLGNEKSTPDALGALTVKDILVTRHLFLLKQNVTDGIRNVCAITPGVTGETGIETSDLILDIITSVKPNFLIVIDSLKASSVDRVNKTIQITDTGITPGSGVNNHRVPILESKIGIPIIAIGIPTVVDVSTIMTDTMNMLLEHISYIKNNFAKNKLVVKEFGNYKNKIKNSKSLTDSEKKELMGILGEMDNISKHMLFEEVLNRFNYNLIVTPKDIDYLLEKLSGIISSALNDALHKSM